MSGVEDLDRHFREAVAGLRSAAQAAGPLDTRTALDLFDAQLESRHTDAAARWMQQQGRGYYTIGSSGHEGNAALALALRPTDPALLHYRSGAFYCARARQAGGVDAVRDMLLGVAAGAEEPIAGGRHKVYGRRELAVVPQTSTIASHLPRAVGVAWSIARAKRLGTDCAWPGDAVVCCSFGDASVNHSTAAGAINSACHAAYQGLPMPILFVCEDNGLGISVPTPPDWVRRAYGNRPALTYFAADGCDPQAAYDTAREAVAHVRKHRQPAFLHLSMVRFLGHAGSDAEAAYRMPSDVAADLRRDPLLATARLLTAAGVLSPQQVLDRYDEVGARVFGVAKEALESEPLTTATQIATPIAPRRTDLVAAAARRTSEASAAPVGEPVTVAQAITHTLADLLGSHPEMVVFGEDVGRKGGVYGLTRGLQRRFGTARVFDTLLDEQAILGLALGAGLSGLLPVAEIQYLAYLHNAEDQLRGEAATLQFFSQGQYRNPLVVRIAGYGYQRGFGGHFHNDNAVGVLRDIPGLVIASPSRPDDAAAMLRTCVAAAKVDGTVSAFLEPIALYHTRDLHSDGDNAWLTAYSPAAQHVPIGRARTYGTGTDLTLVTFGNGLRISLRAARRLEQQGIACRVVDLRWLAPLPVDDLLREAHATGRVLVVDETRRTGGVSEGVVTALIDAGFTGAVRRVTSVDSFVPLGQAAQLVLVSEDDVERAAGELLSGGR
ncbi:thiamine pyrophosphate-dependent enzyme [Streptomyces sp. TLI_185]|uniref:thiamine pyrophosphate-dependent enzyme n=1 Tax=Streptomyces sp. TLI_185 TaxID=2485151 RepID=UPI000F4EA5AB|nr:thiamine pyrophosphate-dependent enzyme [Streptomyces sp. TLI_185]RPF38638.1 2-oxoisovalerate dehydrogenase E1 component [Streptomyces sp. TLI_185]